tara:strand:- start:91 stop:549 length:459 start_codon:yes stop_codon:yes gene_type:complete
MARMAKSDADLYRTIGEQNASVRQMVDDLVPPDDATTAPPKAALAASALLPAEECALPALKKRFGKVAEAQAWIEEQIGKAPTKPTKWAVIEATCQSGAWPIKASTSKARPKAITEDTLRTQLENLEHRLDQRLDRLEAMLSLLAQAQLKGH